MPTSSPLPTAGLTEIVFGGPYLVALMSDETIWRANAAETQPFAWSQLAAFTGTGAPTHLAVIKAYDTPVISDPEAWIPCVYSSDGTYWIYSNDTGSWINAGSGPP
jgi:hypothetical protein